MTRGMIEDVMYGKKNSTMIEGFLYILSRIYATGLFLKRALFAVCLLKRKNLPCRVISIGNLTLGGTGKTPTVIQIAELLIKNKKFPAVVSRGYGRRNESELVVVSDGKVPLADTRIGGDEPSLIGFKIPGLPVVVGKDRYQAGLFTIQVFGSDTVVLDDGFQHIRLHRDLDIVLIDAEDPFGRGRLFPSGILREPVAALKRAHIVLITRTNRTTNLDSLKAEIRKKTKARIFTSIHDPVDLIEAKTGETRSLAALRGTVALAFCGIARPLSFVSLLKSLGADVRHHIFFPDHYEYTKADMAAVFQKAVDVNATLIVTTEKDAVRLKQLNPDGIWALRIALKVKEAEEWETMVLGKEHRLG